MAKKKEIQDDVPEVKEVRSPKKSVVVRMYHKNNSVIDISQDKVEAHKAAGWRLEK